jgi:hypothetical protein
MKYWTILGTTLVAASALLAGCGDKADTPTQAASQGPQAQAKKGNTEQQLVEKYNIYVDVSNSLSTSFQEARENYVDSQVPLLQAKAPLTSLRIQNDILVDRSAKRLDAAVAIDAPLPEIDESAKAFSAALKVLSDNRRWGHESPPGPPAALPVRAAAAVVRGRHAEPGLPPISLGIGEPKHPTPALHQAGAGARAWMPRHDLTGYPPTAGTPAAAQAFAGWLQRRYGCRWTRRRRCCRSTGRARRCSPSPRR